MIKTRLLLYLVLYAFHVAGSLRQPLRLPARLRARVRHGAHGVGRRRPAVAINVEAAAAVAGGELAGRIERPPGWNKR